MSGEEQLAYELPPHHLLKLQCANKQSRPFASPPIVCQLCHQGFRSVEVLYEHVTQKHGNWAEYRKRVFFLAQEGGLKPLLFWNKRLMLQSFSYFQQFCVPGKAPDWVDDVYSKAIPRREVACCVCAVKDWIDNRFECFLFQEATQAVTEVVSDELLVEPQDDNHDAEITDPNTDSKLFTFRDSYCFGPAEKINKFFSVEHYAKLMPNIPLEELHASAIEHPKYSYHWLLHARRVPCLQTRPKNNNPSDYAPAGIGDPDQKAWVCKECRDHLCCAKPTMPPLALSNLFWLGRQHPLFSDLTLGEQLLLGLGRPAFRKVLLGKGAAEENYSGLNGNTILLAQAQAAVSLTLPPSVEDLQDSFVVAFCKSIEEVGQAKMLMVSRNRYLECLKIRKN